LPFFDRDKDGWLIEEELLLLTKHVKPEVNFWVNLIYQAQSNIFKDFNGLSLEEMRSSSKFFEIWEQACVILMDDAHVFKPSGTISPFGFNPAGSPFLSMSLLVLLVLTST
jgi:hypothetical protein